MHNCRICSCPVGLPLQAWLDGKKESNVAVSKSSSHSWQRLKSLWCLFLQIKSIPNTEETIYGWILISWLFLTDFEPSWGFFSAGDGADVEAVPLQCSLQISPHFDMFERQLLRSITSRRYGRKSWQTKTGGQHLTTIGEFCSSCTYSH